MVSPASTPPACPFEKRFPSQLVRDDTFFMSLAYNQAIDAWRQDEVPIGAVIVRDGGAEKPGITGMPDTMMRSLGTP